jgi:hypothetical protein
MLAAEDVLRGLSYYGSGRRLQAVAAKLLAGQPIKVFTLGGSVTKGQGASTAPAAYPSRLFELINATFPHRQAELPGRLPGPAAAAAGALRAKRPARAESLPAAADQPRCSLPAPALLQGARVCEQGRGGHQLRHLHGLRGTHGGAGEGPGLGWRHGWVCRSPGPHDARRRGCDCGGSAPGGPPPLRLPCRAWHALAVAMPRRQCLVANAESTLACGKVQHS